MDYSDYFEAGDPSDDSYDGQVYYEDYENGALEAQLPEDARSRLLSLWQDCTLPIIQQSSSTVSSLICLSLVIPLLSASPIITVISLHVSSLFLGLGAVLIFFADGWQLLAFIALSSCFSLFLSHKCFPRTQFHGVLMIGVIFCISMYCEVFLDASRWHRLRGPSLLMAMRAISVAIDADRESHDGRTASPLAFLGYLFCPGTVVFGPWIPFSAYVGLIERRNTKTFGSVLRWLKRILGSVIQSMLALFLSVCVASLLLSEVHDPFGLPEFAVTWLAASRDAFSFRSSHYFVSFMSRATLLALGAGWAKADEEPPAGSSTTDNRQNDDEEERNDKSKENEISLEVTSPLKVELPRSLVEVVIFWNVPMHHWLKQYVFRPSRPLLGTGLSILLTYAVSSLLHGLNFQMAAVLLSLGLYSYTEHILRSKLSKIFDSCVLARACPQPCQHLCKHDNVYVMICNFSFSCIAIFHLAYLGVMFDNSEEQVKGYSMEHTLEKWSQLGYASHWLALFCLFFHLII